MKAILISIKPKYLAKILNGEKTIEIRKTMPKCDLPIDVYIYCTKEKEKCCFVDYRPCGNSGYLTTKLDCMGEELNSKVVAKFTLNKVEEISLNREHFVNDQYSTDDLDWQELIEKSCLSYKALDNYLQCENGYAWHIDDLVIFDRPKELSEFSVRCPKADVKFNGVKGKMLAYKPLTKAPQNFCYVEV